MEPQEDTNVRAPSTRWEWRRVKIPPAPQAPSSEAAAGVHRDSRSAWEPRQPISLTVVRRGGPEAWYELRARGRVHRFTGVTALEDVMQAVYGENGRC